MLAGKVFEKRFAVITSYTIVSFRGRDSAIELTAPRSLKRELSDACAAATERVGGTRSQELPLETAVPIPWDSYSGQYGIVRPVAAMRRVFTISLLHRSVGPTSTVRGRA